MNKRTLIFIGVLVVAGLAWAGANTMQPGGAWWTIGNGGLLSVLSGGELDVTSGTVDANSATVDLDGCTTTIDGGTTTFGATETVNIQSPPYFISMFDAQITSGPCSVAITGATPYGVLLFSCQDTAAKVLASLAADSGYAIFKRASLAGTSDTTRVWGIYMGGDTTVVNPRRDL